MLRVEIETYDGLLAFDLMGNPSTIDPGQERRLDGDVTVTIEAVLIHHGGRMPDVLAFGLGFGKDASVQVVAAAIAAWLAPYLQKRSVTEVRIGGKMQQVELSEVDVDREYLKRIIMETIREEESG